MSSTNYTATEGMLFTDAYQITMAQVYYRMGLHEKTVQFDYFFRSYPDYGSHKAGYCVSAGLDWLLDWMETTHFRDEDINYLRGLKSRSGEQLFDEDFLQYLRTYGDFLGISMRAIPEGRVVHPNEPLVVVQGPLAMAQILETSLLNHLNYQTLIATKAARIHDIGRGQLLLEFGLRRAQGRAANEGARAAMIGGADYTSNVALSAQVGQPPKGTHAHSMVQLYMTLGMGELEAFRAYAEVYPDDTLLLVDTINTLESGIPNAIKVFEELRAKGHEPVGIRLDSGDLAYLSIQAARMLDKAGFPNTTIVLSNNLDELVIWQIITQIQGEAQRYGVDPDALIRRLTYGVGTRLITSWGNPALDGVYKLVAVREDGGWLPAIKISESPEKTPNPGFKRVWRIYDRRGKASADYLSLQNEDPRKADRLILRHPSDRTKFRIMNKDEISDIELLLQDVLINGKRVNPPYDLEELRARRMKDIERLDSGVRRIVNPHIYHVSLSRNLFDLKMSLIDMALEDLK